MWKCKLKSKKYLQEMRSKIAFFSSNAIIFSLLIFFFACAHRNEPGPNEPGPIEGLTQPDDQLEGPIQPDDQLEGPTQPDDQLEGPIQPDQDYPQAEVNFPLCTNENARIHAEVRLGNTLYVGGNFTHIGAGECLRAEAVILNAETHILFPLDSPNSEEEMGPAVSDDQGGFFVAINSKGVGASSLARINAEGEVNRLNTNLINGRVQALVIHNNTLFLGGQFSINIDESNRINYLAAYDVSNRNNPTPLRNWNLNINEPVLALATHNNILYVVGDSNNLAAYDVSNRDTTPTLRHRWNLRSDLNLNGSVNALSTHNNSLYMGGEFTLNISSETTKNLAAFDISDQNRTPTLKNWAPNPNANANEFVFGLAIHSHTLFVGGDFDQISGEPKNNLAAFDLPRSNTQGAGTPTLKQNWSPNIYIERQVPFLASSANKLYVVASNFIDNSKPIKYLAAFDVSDETPRLKENWLPKSDAPDAPVYALAIDNSTNTLFVGGEFGEIGGSANTNRLAAFNLSNENPILKQNWNPNPNADVYALAIHNKTNTLFVGGEFEEIGGSANTNGLAAFDISNENPSLKEDLSRALRERPVVADSNNSAGDPHAVHALAFHSRTSTLFFGGFLTNSSTRRASYLAAFDVSDENPRPIPNWHPIVEFFTPLLDLLSIDNNTNTLNVNGAQSIKLNSGEEYSLQVRSVSSPSEAQVSFDISDPNAIQMKPLNSQWRRVENPP